jgi:hypothetical protein
MGHDKGAEKSVTEKSPIVPQDSAKVWFRIE